ncbi:hypothetical protein BDV93DRAFT_520883 [Ceratobasidium sp. AG-I]|nr:hypothetical protein BDV93DRAFT_520883 [Ceratobasidium sp. AG-I]
MPKDRTRKRFSQTHQSSAKVAARKFAVPEGETEKLVENPELKYMEANDLLRSAPVQDTHKPSTLATTPTQTKKEKQQLKHEQFLQRLTSGVTPYSKSHNRRLKRKVKSELSTDLASVGNALNTLASESPSQPGLQSHPQPRPAKISTTLIGEGKGVTLTKSQRRRALELERLRQSSIMEDPEFRSNPFAAIRTHAQNSLLSHIGSENAS